MALLSLLRPAASWLAPAGRGARLSILIYHRVRPELDPLQADVDVAEFRWQMRLLAQQFNVLPLAEAVHRLRRGDLPARAVCVSFDDGYADNATIALPILQEYGVPATFFIAAGYLDGGRMWNDTVIEALRRIPDGELDLSALELGRYRIASLPDRRAALASLLPRLKYLAPKARQGAADYIAALASEPLPDHLMMSSAQLKTLHAAGMAVGGHTVSHPILARLPPAAARNEIAAGREQLEALLGVPVRLFAYPNGKPGQDYLPEHVEMARELGFAAAVSTAWGAASAATDCWQLPRFTPWDKTPARFMARLLLNYRQALV